MRFSNREKKDLFFADVMISLAFAVLFSGGYTVLTSLNSSLFAAFIIAFLTAGVGFLLHETMHKLVAQSYGLFAEFRASYSMLWLALLLSFFGFIVAAPGAVFISGFNINKKKNGKISLAGPMANIFLAILFLMLLIVFGSENVAGEIFSLGLTINSLLAAFNMIPLMPFDGAKIYAWDKTVYTITVIAAVGLSVGSWVI